jgi:hypothetical protein
MKKAKGKNVGSRFATQIGMRLDEQVEFSEIARHSVLPKQEQRRVA